MERDGNFRPVVLMPTFNNARTLRDVLERALAQGQAVIVIDDGCTDQTADELGAFEGRVQVIRHSCNRGKAAALRTGFAAASDAGYTHAITIDTDGQLDPAQIPDFVEMARGNPRALVVGCRDETAADYPARSRTGRRVSNFLVRLESGAEVSDSQCGFRVYPLEMVRIVRCSAGHFGFETEVITRAAWAGCEMRELPVYCTYHPTGGRVSHFRPWLDSIRAVGMHARLVVRALVPVGFRKWNDNRPAIVRAPRWKSGLDWINPARAWRELRQQRAGRTEMAVGVGTGVLIANLPLYPVQTLFALYTAKRLHLNPLSVVFGSQLSTPPINVALIAAAISLGHFLTHGTWIAISWVEVRDAGLLRMTATWLVDWAIGGAIIGVVLGAVAFAMTRIALGWIACDSVE